MNEAHDLSMEDLEEYDSDAPAADANGNRRFHCPLLSCSKSAAPYRKLSASVDVGMWQCFGCKSKGKLVEFRCGRRGPSRLVSTPSYIEQRAPSRNEIAAVRKMLAATVELSGTEGEAYVGGRGLVTSVASSAGVLFSPNWYGRAAVVFPMLDTHRQVVAASGRFLSGVTQPKCMDVGAKRCGVFVTPGALDASTVVVTEGAIDALSLATCGVPAVAIMGLTCPKWLRVRLASRKVVIALDADEEGDRASDELISRLTSLGARCRRLSPPEIKDWNDSLTVMGPLHLVAWLSEQSIEAEDSMALEEGDVTGESVVRLQRSANL